MIFPDGRLGRRIDLCDWGDEHAVGFERCEIGREIRIDGAKLVQFRLGKHERIIDDALLLGAAVEYCDRRQERPARGLGRVLHVRMPVYELARWQTPEVQKSLREAAQKLTADEWTFEFKRRQPKDDWGLQTNIEIPEPESVIIPFSRGMDSWAISRLLAEKRPVLVHIGGSPNNRKRMQNRNRPLPFEEIPLAIKSKGLEERSGRGRGFKFAMVSGLAAYLSGAHTVVVPESGQGALGPVLTAHRYGDFRSHPLFLSRMAIFLKALLDHEIRYEFPRLKYTKGETLREAVDQSGEPTWLETRSCWQKSRRIPLEGRQCGFCAACMLRRLSVHAAGLEEPIDTYACEDLSAPDLAAAMMRTFDVQKLEGKSQDYAVAGALHLDHLAALHRTDVEAGPVGRSVRALSRAMKREEADMAQKVKRMLEQHDTEWRAFLRSLDRRSFIRKWCAAP